jgi:hypothetical protein
MRADSSSLIIYFQCIHDDDDCDMVRLGGLRGTIYYTSSTKSSCKASQSQKLVVGLEGKKNAREEWNKCTSSGRICTEM